MKRAVVVIGLLLCLSLAINYFGEVIRMDVYADHVHLIDGDHEYWYEVSHAPDTLYPSAG